MPRYFFDIGQNDRQLRDEIGTELAHDGDAWKEAMRTMRQTDGVLMPGDNGGLQSDVTGELFFELRSIVLSVAQRGTALEADSDGGLPDSP
jgi:hypothetical protein